MAPDILTAVTSEQLYREPELDVYVGLVIETGFDPEEPWYPCGCPQRLNDGHEDDCWLGWVKCPQWMLEPTAEVPVIESPSDVDSEEVEDAEVPGAAIDAAFNHDSLPRGEWDTPREEDDEHPVRKIDD